MIPQSRRFRTVYRALLTVAALTFLVFFPRVSVQAQSATDNGSPLGLAAGSPEGSYALSGFENVNLYNGNLSFSLPALQIGGRGSAGYRMQIPIDQHWVAVKDRWIDEFGNEQFTIYASFMGGVLPYAGNYYGPGSVDIRYSQWRGIPCTFGTAFEWARASIVFTAPDGTEHELVDQATLGQPRQYGICAPNGYSRGNVFVSNDGAGMTFISDSPINDMPYCCPVSLGGLLKMRDGTVYRVDSISHGGPGWQYFTRIISWIRDPNGNKTTFTYTTGEWGDLLTSIKDSLNRVVNIEYGVTEAPYGLCDRITYKGFGGATRTIHVTKGNLSTALRPGILPQNYEQLFPQLDGEGPFEQMMITGVWFPDTDGVTRRYRFLYNSYGELARVELPTGGAMEYDWGAGLANGATGGVMPQIPNVVHPQDNADPDIPGIYRRILSRRVYDVGNLLLGSTTYSRPETQNYDNSVNNLGYVSVSHLNASGTQLSVDNHYFYGSPARSFFSWENSPRFMPAYSPFGGSWEGKEYQTDLYAANGTTLLRRNADAWGHPSVPWWSGSPEEGPANNPYVNETVSTLADSGQVRKTTHVNPQTGQTMIDQFGNFTDTWLYDYGQGSPGSLLTRSHTDYLTVNPANGVNYTNRTSASSPHMLSLVTTTSIYNAGVVEQARTSFEYDNYATDNNHAALLSRSSISGLDAGYTMSYKTRGNVTGTTRYLLTNGSVTGSISAFAQYDVAGSAVKTIDARGYATNVYFLDCFGAPNAEAHVNSAPVELSSVGQASYAFATSATNTLGQTAYAQFDFYSGRSVDAEDPNGVVVSGYFNDVLDRPTQVIRGSNLLAPFKSKSTFSYDDVNRIITTTSDLSSYDDPNPLKGQTLYDGLGRTTENRQYETASNYIVARQQYDALGRVYQTSNPFRPWNSETPVWTMTAYDALSRIISVTTPDGAAVTTGYNGNSVTVTEQTGKSRKSVSDALGRLMQVYEDPNGLNYVTNYSYDVLGNLLSVSQGSQTRTFAYNSLSRLMSATNLENGTVTFDYDNNGNLLHKTDARNITTTLAYDPLNRPTSKTYQNDPSNTPPVGYFYDNQNLPAGAPSFTRGPAIGRLVAMTYGTNSSAGDYYGFDPIGRTAIKIQRTGGINYQVGVGYNVAGVATSETYPSGHTVSYGLDQAGRLSSFTGNLGDGVSRNYSTGIIYSSLGGMSKEQFGTDTPIYNKLWYNVRGQLSEIRESTSYAGPGDTSWNRGAIINQYASNCWACSGPDNNGNLKQQEVYIPNNEQVTSYTSWAQIYTYDSLNRVTQVNEYTGNPALDWQQKYTIDRYGNRTIDVNNTSPNIPRPAFNLDTSTNRLTVPAGQSGTMSYDNAGNLVTDSYTGGGGRTYDAENRMISANGSSLYTYDGEGKRIRRSVTTGTGKGATTVETWQVYGLGGELLAEYPANGASSSPQKEYGYRSGQMLVTAEPNAQIHWLVTDHLGTPRMVFDRSGSFANVSRHDYLPFGEELVVGQGLRNASLGFAANDYVRQHFTGYERDNESGLDYAHARYYASGQGRFTGVDPIGGKPTDPQTLNRYAYVGNDPLNATDPTGMFANAEYGQDPNRDLDPYIWAANKRGEWERGLADCWNQMLKNTRNAARAYASTDAYVGDGIVNSGAGESPEDEADSGPIKFTNVQLLADNQADAEIARSAKFTETLPGQFNAELNVEDGTQVFDQRNPQVFTIRANYGVAADEYKEQVGAGGSTKVTIPKNAQFRLATASESGVPGGKQYYAYEIRGNTSGGSVDIRLKYTEKINGDNRIYVRIVGTYKSGDPFHATAVVRLTRPSR